MTLQRCLLFKVNIIEIITVMSSRKGAAIDRKVPLVIPQTAASSRTVVSSRTRFSKVPEQPDQAQILKTVTRRELAGLVCDLERLRRENEFLLHQQETKFGVTVDTADALKRDLDKAKAINNDLLGDIAASKEKHDRLYEGLIELQEKFDACEMQLKKYRKEKKHWDNTNDRLRVVEDRCRRLVSKNKALKFALLKNGIKPDTDMKNATFESESKVLKNHIVTSKVKSNEKAAPKTIRWI